MNTNASASGVVRIQARLLRCLEQARRTAEELDVAGPTRVHLGHIYPQRPPTDRRLPNHAALLYRLGNLTLLSRQLNTSVKNSDFAAKQEKAYAGSEILLTRDLAAMPSEWGRVEIETRQAQLAELAAHIWCFDDELLTLNASADRSTNVALDLSGATESVDILDPEQLPVVPEDV